MLWLLGQSQFVCGSKGMYCFADGDQYVLLTAANTGHWVQAYLETHGHHADQEKVADLLAKVCAATA